MPLSRSYLPLLIAAVTILTTAALLPRSAEAATPSFSTGSHGYDISWPQCPNDFPEVGDFAIVGINNGKARSTNPCFVAEVQWARTAPQGLAFYVNTNAPPRNYSAAGCSRRDTICIARAYGTEAADYSVAAARSFAPDVDMYWLDVERGNTWSRDKEANAAVLEAMVERLQASGKQVGIYSTKYQFESIAGNWAPGLDNWVPGQADNLLDAPAACRTSPAFGGGRVVMVQWTDVYDENYVC